MASCKDCVHCGVCGTWKNAESLTQQMERAETLDCFKNKADVVEVVRCKDCKRFEPHGNGKCGICRKGRKSSLQQANDYCSEGERRE